MATAAKTLARAGSSLFGRILASVPAAATKNVPEDELMSTPDARYRNPVDHAPDAGNRFRQIGHGEVRSQDASRLARQNEAGELHFAELVELLEPQALAVIGEIDDGMKRQCVGRLAAFRRDLSKLSVKIEVRVEAMSIIPA